MVSSSARTGRKLSSRTAAAAERFIVSTANGKACGIYYVMHCAMHQRVLYVMHYAKHHAMHHATMHHGMHYALHHVMHYVMPHAMHHVMHYAMHFGFVGHGHDPAAVRRAASER